MSIEDFSNLIKEDYERLGSYGKLARLTKIGNTTLQHWAKDIKTEPSLMNIITYAKAIDCPAERKAKYFEACGYPVPEEFRADAPAGVVPDIPPEDIVQVPVVGSVHAGELYYATEDIEEYMSIGKDFLRDAKKHFMLRITGDCMDAAGLPEGSYALVAVDKEPENGQIAVLRCEDETIVRKYKKQNGVVMLVPVSTNPEYEPIILNGSSEWVIVGTVTLSVTKL